MLLLFSSEVSHWMIPEEESNGLIISVQYFSNSHYADIIKREYTKVTCDQQVVNYTSLVLLDFITDNNDIRKHTLV